MEKFTLPDYNIYIRYSAYVKLKSEVIKRCERDGRPRYASVVIKSIILNSADTIVNRCSITTISIGDTVTAAVNKQSEVQLFENFKSYVLEAATTFIQEVSRIDGPTISEIDTVTDKVIQNVVTELITV